MRLRRCNKLHVKHLTPMSFTSEATQLENKVLQIDHIATCINYHVIGQRLARASNKLQLDFHDFEPVNLGPTRLLQLFHLRDD